MDKQHKRSAKTQISLLTRAFAFRNILILQDLEIFYNCGNIKVPDQTAWRFSCSHVTRQIVSTYRNNFKYWDR